MGESGRILVVEDEETIAEVLQYNLEREGFTVDLVTRGDRVLEAVRTKRPDLVLLDLMLPGLGGLEVTRLLRRDPRTAELPLVMLTARDQEVDRIVGFELGADDYITKPFSPREVILRVKAVLRRARAAPEPSEVLTAGEIRLDLGAFRAWVGEREVELTATELRLLAVLVERRGRVQTRADLLRDVWQYAEDTDSRTVDTHVRRLRQKLGEAAEHIETVVGVGYRLGTGEP